MMMSCRSQQRLEAVNRDKEMPLNPTQYHKTASSESSNLIAVKDFQRVRDYSMKLAAPLSEEDCCAQSMCDASPIKWHLAHTSWFFETFVLEPYEPGFMPFHRAYRVLFNSYYDGVGGKYPRAQRGLLTRPSLAEIRAYRVDVDRRVRDLLLSAERECDPGCLPLLVLGLHHEQQHQELMLTDLQHLLSLNPLEPAYLQPDATPLRSTAAESEEWVEFDAGVVEIGHRAGTGRFCFDNELPRHRQFVEPFACATRLVTNAEYVAFVEDGGYDDPNHWLSAGWDWRCDTRAAHPLYWRRRSSADNGNAWREFTLHGSRPLDPDAAVTHVSYYEADAFARWSGARLPTEAEWEHAAANISTALQEDDQHWHGRRMLQVFGTAWQWTSSAYAPYPGYVAPTGAVGEYNGKFMVNQYVLRGSSAVTSAGHARLSYRNFFPATARWQYTGIRLAKSLP